MLAAPLRNHVSAQRQDRFVWLGFGAIILGLAIAANAILGPLVFGVFEYPVSESMLHQTFGLDTVNLLVVAPFLVLVGSLALRHHRAAPLLAVAPAIYAAYMFARVIVGPDYVNYPRGLLLQLGVVVLALWLAVRSWRIVDSNPLTNAPPVKSWHALGLFAMAGFVVFRYLPPLLGSFSAAAVPTEVAADHGMYWTIVLLDLGGFVPICAAVAVGVLRRARWAMQAMRAVAMWFVLTSMAVTGMSAAMMMNGDSGASWALLGTLGAISAVSLWYAIALASPLFETTMTTRGLAQGHVDA